MKRLHSLVYGFVLMLLCVMLSSPLQGQDVVSDSAYITSSAGRFTANRAIGYDNGNGQVISQFLGDTSQAFTLLLQGLKEKANSLAADAAVVSRYRGVINDMGREATAIRTATGRSPLDTIRRYEYAPMQVDGWRIRTLTGTNAITFSVNAQGTTRWRTDTAAQARALQFFGPIIRLQAFPAAGGSTDLYRLRNGNYVNLDRTVVLLRPGAATQPSASRSAEPPSTARSVAAPPELSSSGLKWVHIDPETNAKYVLAPAEPGTYTWDGAKWTAVPAAKRKTGK